MTSTEKVSIGRNYIHLILLSIFLKFFDSFVDCSFCILNDYNKKTNKLRLLIFLNSKV